ncbi:hypothetical protein pb186bvf_005106 [Paramecium bursaria]
MQISSSSQDVISQKQQCGPYYIFINNYKLNYIFSEYFIDTKQL